VVTICRLRLICDATRAETRFRLSAKRTSPFKSAEASVQSTTGSRRVRISVSNGSNAGYTMFWGSVTSTIYPLHSPDSPSIPLPCVTVCHHISTGLYHPFNVHNILRSAHAIYSCVLYGSEYKQRLFPYTAFITETENVYCAVRVGSLYVIQVMCFAWISEQTAIVSLYSINWLVCTTETESVHCAVRAVSLCIIQVNFSV
jgi:hypothetical protein